MAGQRFLWLVPRSLSASAHSARWRCIGYSDGRTSGIMSLTDAGRL
jgi:hypothetical protein